MNSVADVWTNVLQQLKKDLSETTITTWFDELTAVDIRENTFYLHCPNDFKKRYIESLFIKNIKAALQDLFSMEFEVKILDEAGLLEFQGGAPKKNSDRFTYEDFTFETFVVGPSNKLAYAAAHAVSDRPGVNYNPLFIYGDSGLGKTHLIYAICGRIRQNHPDYKLLYVKGEEFANELILAIRNGTTAEFKEKYRQADLLAVDDIQFIAGKESTQEEFFHTFNSLYECGKQIILTSDRPPKEIKTLEDRLRTRFEWGLLVDVQPPDFETRMAIISRKADSLGLKIPEDVAAFIAGKLKDNVRQLEGVVKRLEAHANLTGAPITILLAENAIQDIMTEHTPLPVTVDRIIDEVARTYGVTAEDIRGQRRSGQISTARQVAMYVVREITGMTQLKIGQEFGGRDHATVVYALQQVTKAIKTDPRKKETIEDIIKNIRNLNG